MNNEELSYEDFLTQLSPEEKEWWSKTIKKFRVKVIKEPKFYAHNIIKTSWKNKENILQNIDKFIRDIREKIWQLYLIDEAKFHSKVLEYLFTERELPANILKSIIKHDFLRSIENKLEMTKEIAKIMGDYSGRIMPYIYELCLSTTQSRRSRAGYTFEQLIESLLELFSITFETQKSVSSGVFKSTGLGKKVDIIVPNIRSYNSNRSKCALVTTKTTLRERWQEVAEELSRTNIPHIYLLTVDENVTENVIITMKTYNIALVVFDSEKSRKFKSHENVTSFYNFFEKEMNHILGYWR